jgi:peptidoglycan/xylan/chitin deacetylase (PgdA/CDA1 family)
MKYTRETYPLIVIMFCFALAMGSWLGFYSRGFFLLTTTAAEKNIAIALPSVPITRANVQVPILVYHSVRPHIKKESVYQDFYDITPELLRGHLEYLKENRYETISFGMLADYFDTGATLPKKSVILSFDDGWKNQYEYAFPLLKEFGATATFFVFTNAINRGNHLTWEQLREMRDAGISIEAHTKMHPYLVKITDPKKLVNEISGSKKILEEELGLHITSFAYPFGTYDDAVVAEVKNSGFRTARTLRGGIEQSESERYVLRASLVTDNFEDFKRFLGN